MTDAEFEAYVKVCPEIELYFVINEYGGFAWRMNHDMGKPGKIPEEHHASIRTDVDAAQARMVLAADQTIRFNVTTPRVMKENTFTGKDQLVASDDYWLWFRLWDGWSKAMTDSEFKEMDADLTAKHDLSKWRPDGDWKARETCSA